MGEKELFALIVAGGSGLRMENTLPKQFINLGNAPILMHTIGAFNEIHNIEILLVLPSPHIEYWESLCVEHNFKIPHKVIAGGKTRGESVLNGLKVLPQEGLVAIHDGVRPFVPKKVIVDSFDVARRKGTAVAAVNLKDSIREVGIVGSKAVDRSMYKIVQTPQTFRISLIRQAYEKIGTLTLSDDASVAESAGFNIELIEGSYDNLKITTSEDLIIAQEILKKL